MARGKQGGLEDNDKGATLSKTWRSAPNTTGLRDQVMKGLGLGRFLGVWGGGLGGEEAGRDYEASSYLGTHLLRRLQCLGFRGLMCVPPAPPPSPLCGKGGGDPCRVAPVSPPFFGLSHSGILAVIHASPVVSPYFPLVATPWI